MKVKEIKDKTFDGFLKDMLIYFDLNDNADFNLAYYKKLASQFSKEINERINKALEIIAYGYIDLTNN